jgi:hypothetical protein
LAAKYLSASQIAPLSNIAPAVSQNSRLNMWCLVKSWYGRNIIYFGAASKTTPIYKSKLAAEYVAVSQNSPLKMLWRVKSSNLAATGGWSFKIAASQIQ